MPLVDYSFFGGEWFESPTSGVRNIKQIEAKNAIYDEIEIRERTDLPNENIRNSWQPDTILLARFVNSLEAGNLHNEGVRIQSFVIKRRKVGDLKDTILAYEPFENNKIFTYIDVTQPNEKFIYTISPISENGIEGQPNTVEIESDFTGYFVIDAETDQVFAFDKAIGDLSGVEKTLNKGKVQINTFSRFPRFINTNQNYNTFSLSTVLIPDEDERSNTTYQRLIQLLNENKPLLVKGSNGSIYVCSVANPRESSPQNTWKGYDYITVTLDFTEVMTYDEYMQQHIKGIVE